MAGKVKKTDRNKAWNRKPVSQKPYAIGQRDKRKVFAIFCEGENTEPAYFRSFPLGNATVKAIGSGKSKTALVESVIRRLDYDPDLSQQEIWIVFDRDATPSEKRGPENDFDKAILMAHKEGWKVAYSNDVFELWFVLHYQDLTAPWTRKQYFRILSRLWNCDYGSEGKQQDFCRRIYQLLQEDDRADQKLALTRASRLYQEKIHLLYSEQNPGTTVFQLVEELNKYL